MKGNTNAVLTALLFLGAIAYSNSASAQLDEIIVTATKRDTSLQDTPISVYAVTGETVEDLAITNFEQLDIPGVNVPRGGMADQIFIRGVGSGVNAGFEQSAPIFLDGVYFGRGRGARAGFLDLKQIEVVKGPQPTYLGKNAIAGAVALSWAKPTDEFEGYVNGTFESEHEEIVLETALSGPISENVRARGAAKYREVSEGWVENLTTSDSEPEIEDLVLRGLVEWDIGEDAMLTFAGWYSEDEERGRNQETHVCTTGGAFAMNVDPNDDCTVNGVRSSFNTVLPTTGYLPDGTESSLVSVPFEAFDTGDGTYFTNFELAGSYLKLDWDISDNVSLMSQTAYYEFTSDTYNDSDQTPADFVVGGNHADFDQISQELRLQSQGDGAVQWMAGFYFDSNDNVVAQNAQNYAMGFSQVRRYDETAESWAAFGALYFDVSDQVSINLGGRYTEVDKDIDFAFCRGDLVTTDNSVVDCVNSGLMGMLAVPYGEESDSTSFDRFQPSVTVNWTPSADILAYVSWKEGFKAGGFDFGANAGANNGFTYDEETVESWEAGVKSTLLDGSAILNLVYFHSDYKDLQVSAFDPNAGGGAGAVITGNAASATSQGFEVETSWAINDNWRASANLTFLDSTYGDYPGAACYGLASPETGVDLCDATRPAVGNNPAGRFNNLAGQQTVYAPDFSGNVSLNWQTPIGVGDNLVLSARFDAFFTDSYFTSADNDPIDRVPAHEKYDLRLGLGDADGDWEIALIGRKPDRRS